MSNNLQYIIVNIGDLSLIDFTQVDENSENTIRKNITDTQFVLKYSIGKIPTFIENGTVVPSETLTHYECLTLMATPEWA